ncbi:MAG TPA: energy-coupling factor ABC transporter permease [Armatimonadota bacterium]|nr:energy-coupling factor ABC transporter permease [Armatimonadota bacterium]
MHLPDGLINDPKIWLGADAVALAVVGYAVYREGKSLKPEEAPMMGVMAAFIFAGQMFKVPIPGGVSGHLMGALLAAVLLGPWRASIVMAVVITVQCLLHADGGWTALGANVINMGLAGTFAGWALYRGLRAIVPGRAGVLIGAGIAAWVTVVIGAVLIGLQIMWGSDANLETPVRALVAVHVPIGLLEAGITVGALGVVLKARPDLLGITREHGDHDEVDADA